ncbi:MAG: branched-chain amino acid transport system substrate-binding protein [Gaiellales bacterium]|jgi:branched-chain amino acid transport system substrate-binding protein|nr:branched-chain amino acid transport system substrate-binding protein [Gaiellales bacterium]
MKKAKSFPLAAAVAAATALAATVTAAPAGAAVQRSTALSCSSTLKLGMLAPLTGLAGFLGQEQLSWAKLAIKTLPPKYGLKIKLVPGDSPVEKGPSEAQTVAQKLIADKSIVGIIGGSTSGSVAATSQAFTQAGLVQVSESATNADLTKGDNQKATKAFFRVVPADDYQGPADANYMINTLHVKNVVIFDFQEPYSQGLGSQVEQTLKKAGITTSHQSVANTVTDFSSYVTKVPSDADIVFFPTQQPPAAQTMASQLAEQGKKAKVFGGDGTNGPGVFKAAGSYVSNFAPQIDTIAADKALIALWKKDNPGKSVGSFGPPTYGAVQVLLTAIKAACDKGKGSIAKRGNVIAQVRKVNIKSGWILGGGFSWSKVNTNDPNVSKYYIMQIQSDGTYKVVN